jgi:heme/copper-type cytochrome/quinol oxidase subunit 3
MTKESLQPIRPLFVLFALLSAFFITGKNWLLKQGIDPNVLIVGNLLLFLVSLTAWAINKKSFTNNNPNAALRALYAGFMIKFFVLALAAFVYIMLVKKNVNKPALIICGAFYIIYTAIEIRALLKMLRKKKDA